MARDFIIHTQPSLWGPPLARNLGMMTSSNGNIFRVTGPLCGEFTGPGEFPTQRPVTRGFDVFFDLRLNKRLSKQPWGWWFETPSWSLWRQCNGSKPDPTHPTRPHRNIMFQTKVNISERSTCATCRDFCTLEHRPELPVIYTMCAHKNVIKIQCIPLCHKLHIKIANTYSRDNVYERRITRVPGKLKCYSRRENRKKGLIDHEISRCTYKRQVVNPRHRTPQGWSIGKPGIPL